MGFYKDNCTHVTIQCRPEANNGNPLSLKSFARWFMIPEKEQERVFKDLSFNRYAYMDTLKPDFVAFIKNYADYRESWPNLPTMTKEDMANMDFLAVSYLLEQEVSFTPRERAENKAAVALFDRLREEQRARAEELSMLSGKNAYMMRQYYRKNKDPQEVKTERTLLKKEYRENKEILPLADAVIKATEKKKALESKKFAFFRDLRLRLADKEISKKTATFKAKQQELFLSAILDPNASIGRVEWRVAQLKTGDFSYVPAPPESGACQPQHTSGNGLPNKYEKYSACFSPSKEEEADLEALTEKFYALPFEKRKELGQRVLDGKATLQSAREELMAGADKATAPTRKSVDLSTRLHTGATTKQATPILTPTRTKEPGVREPNDN